MSESFSLPTDFSQENKAELSASLQAFGLSRVCLAGGKALLRV